MARILLLTLLAGVSYALISTLEVEHDDRNVFHISTFGYEANGVFELNLSDLMMLAPTTYNMPTDNQFNLAFVLHKSDYHTAPIMPPDGEPCMNDLIFPDNPTDVIKLSDRNDWIDFKYKKVITEPGYYHLYFSNCEVGTQVTFNIKFEEYNVDDGERVYMSTGLSHLPLYIGGIGLFFVGSLVSWSMMLKRQISNVRSIHWLMLVVLVVKVITIFFETAKFQALKSTGVHDAWTYLFDIFSFIKGMMLFAVIIFLGTGWSYLKPFLTERDKTIMLVTMVVQGMVNVAMIVVDETTPGAQGWYSWSTLLKWLDVACCMVILMPISWSIDHLNSASGTDSKAARNSGRLGNFRLFYILVVFYIYVTRVILTFLDSTLPLHDSWIIPVCTELASLLLYLTTGYLFRPQEASPYLALSKDDDDFKEPLELTKL